MNDNVKTEEGSSDKNQQTETSQEYVTSELSKRTGSEKEKIIQCFRHQVWPALAALGWTKVRRTVVAVGTST
jgi:hypothetical protein